MSALTMFFIAVIICAEIDFFAVLYCKEISEWLNAKSEEIRARAESLRKLIPPITQATVPDTLTAKQKNTRSCTPSRFSHGLTR